MGLFNSLKGCETLKEKLLKVGKGIPTFIMRVEKVGMRE